MTELERYKYDVLVIGAGGAGLRAAVEARETGLRVAIICKSLFGKAHTVMAEGGAAASMGNVNVEITGRFTSATQCAAENSLTITEWLNSTQKNLQIASTNLRCGALSLIAPKRERLVSVTLVGTNTHV